MAKQILVIDDEQVVLDMLRKFLTRQGYEVFTTSQHEEAFRILKDRQIALILLDICMPEKSGFDLYQEFEPYKDTPVLFITGYPQEFFKESEQVLDMWRTRFIDGTTDILHKPFDIELLLEKITGLVGE